MSHRFLITGLPRIRSAWLCALFSSNEVECWHDPIHHGSTDDLLDRVKASTAPVAGICDPSAACIYPQAALRFFADSPIVIIRRSESASLDGLTQWGGRPPNDWPGMLRNHTWFIDHAATLPQMMWVKFSDLDDFEVVSALYALCTQGMALDKRRFELFNTLKIEQHRDKAIAAAIHFRQ